MSGQSFPFEKRKSFDAALRPLLALVLIAALSFASSAYAEPPNPFGGNQGTTDRKDFEEENDVLSDPVENFGFDPPENLAPPPLPEGGGFGQASPPPPSAPPPAATPEPRRAGRTSPRANPPARTAPPSALGGAAAKAAAGAAPPAATTGLPTGGGKPAPKLDEYLELESSVKGLQVQNFDLPDKDIKDVVTLISKWTGKNFILDSKVRGKITILGPSQVTLQEAYQAFLSALEANGLTTVKSGKFIRIIESAEARRAPVETFTGDVAPDTDQFITRIFQLQYISADEVQREFRDLVTRQGKLFAYAPTNSIIITDTGSNIRRIEDILRTLDVKGFETSLHVLRIRYSSAKQIADMLDQIYGEERSGTGGRPRTSFRRSALERTRGGGIISKVIPDEQTNSLIVLANSAGFRSLVRLVQKLDVRVTDTGRIHVYYCEYAKAEDLASTLASLSGSGSGSSRSSSSSRRNTRVTTPSGAPATSLSGNAPGGNAPSGPVTAELGEGVKVTADPATNALVITASSTDYQTLKRVIKKLDIPRLQVFVETAILEVTLENKKNISVNLATAAQGVPFGGGSISDVSQLQGLVTGTQLPEGATIPILAGSRVQANIGGQTVNLRSFMAIINFLTKTTNTSVLSTPQILALDNEKSEFKVQDEIPVQTGIPGTSAAGAAASVASIDRLKTGIEIKLTPHVNAASRTVRLEIEQKVDSLAANSNVPSALAQIQKAKTTRETNTNVVVRDGDLIMMGGLMSDRVEEAVTKVPLLGDIPILGWLFKRTDNTIVKTNLIILLQPRIIGTSLDGAELISEKFRKRREFLDRNNGGEDEHGEAFKELNRKVESQRRRGRGGSAPAYRNDEEEEAPPAKSNEDESGDVKEDFADPDQEPKKTSSAPKKEGIKSDPKKGQPVTPDPNVDLIPEEGSSPAEDAMLVPPDADLGGGGGGEGFSPPPAPDGGDGL
jgi:general secretion pathway protein D